MIAEVENLGTWGVQLLLNVVFVEGKQTIKAVSGELLF
jgi:hypothetical protein